MIPPDALLHIYEVFGKIDDPEDTPESFIGLWNEDSFTYLFFLSKEDSYVTQLCSSANCDFGDRHEIRYSDWQTGAPPQGIRLGLLKVVSPGSDTDPEDKVLVLDPSVVFGDGNHPTTAACINYMAEIMKRYSIASILDLGTGTGILALAGVMLGADRVLAVDKNKLAVKTALRNVALNAMEIQVREGEARIFIDAPFDLVLANLPFSVLRDLIDQRGADKHRWWIVSGINREQADVLKEMLRERSFRITMERFDSPWITFCAGKDEENETCPENTP